MELLRVDDPRSPLERARRPELVAFAQANGLKDITEDMPAIIIRKRLKERGLVNINVPIRHLGTTYVADPAVTTDQTPAVSAEDALEAEYKAQAEAPARPDYGKMGLNELRAACKERGIKMERRDNTLSLRAKLNGQ